MLIQMAVFAPLAAVAVCIIRMSDAAASASLPSQSPGEADVAASTPADREDVPRQPAATASLSDSSSVAASTAASSSTFSPSPLAAAAAVDIEGDVGVVMEEEDETPTTTSTANQPLAASSSEYTSSPDVSPTASPSHQQQLHAASGPLQSSYESSFLALSGANAAHRCSEFECISPVASYCLYCGYQCTTHATSVHATLAYRHHMVRTLAEQEQLLMIEQFRQYLPDPSSSSLAARQARRQKDRRRRRHTRGLGRGNMNRMQESASAYSRGFEPLLLVFDQRQTWLEWSMQYLVRPLLFSTVNMMATEWMADYIQAGIRKWTRPPVQEVLVTQIPSGSSSEHVQQTMPVGPQRADQTAPGSGMTTRR
jgi:hypothetical protein